MPFSISYQDESIPWAANSPRSAKLSVPHSLVSESEDGDPDVVVVAPRPDPDPERAARNLLVLDGDGDEVVALEGRLPGDAVFTVLNKNNF